VNEPLRGITVIEFGEWLAGPMVGRLLLDQGAAVIHVDRPGGSSRIASTGDQLHHGKQRVTIDLKTAADLRTARSMVASSDVLVENFRPGVMTRLGLGWDSVRHEQLIYCSLPGFAEDDPRATVPAWEGVLGAATGFYRRRRPQIAEGTAATPNEASRPRFNALPVASHYAALVAVVAIVMALIARERDGEGQRIEVPLFDAMFQAIGAGGLLVDDSPAGARPVDPWNGTFSCQDGQWVRVNLATPRFVQRFLSAAGVLDEWQRQGYLDGERLTPGSSIWSQQQAALESLLRTRSAAAWDEVATSASLPITAIRATTDWASSRHARDAGIILQDTVTGGETRLRAGPPVRICPLPKRGDGATDRALNPGFSEPEGRRPVSAALEGVRVVDTTQVLAGPTAARTLAEFGADVVKVNNPYEEGAGYRWHVHRYHTDVNRGKETILVDLKRQEGMDILWHLVDRADVFLQNLRLGVAERLGFGYEAVATRRPNIVYLSVSAFGYGGEWERRPGYEPNAQALTGMQARLSGGVDWPADQPFAINDYCTGLLGAFGLALGILRRFRTGQGAHVQTSLAHAATFLQSPYLSPPNGRSSEPSGPDVLGWGPLQRLYQAADEWVYIGATAPDDLHRVPELADLVALDGEELQAELERRIHAKSAARWVETLTASGIGASSLATVPELMRDAWVVSHGLSVTRRDASDSLITTIGPSARLSRTPVVPGRLAPAPGADAEAVLSKIDMAAELPRLVEQGVIAVS
jgi:crotonobetainyl-CoA:carnitine CoA-transferase CaiB-like acyl-CoA transferase